MGNFCDTGIKRVVLEKVQGKPWFKYKEDSNFVEVIGSPKGKILHNKIHVARSLAETFNKAINSDINIGKVFYAVENHDGAKTGVYINPSDPQLKLLNADENKQREEAINFAHSVKKEKEQIESRLSRTDQRYVSEFESRVKSSLDNAKVALKSAINAGDIDAQVSAQQQIAELTLEAARLGALKSTQQDVVREKEVTITPQQTNQTPQTDPKAEDWASRNNWFGNDSAMTYTAFDLHKKLVEEEGFDPRSDEYYAEIDKRIRLEFPHKFAIKEDISTESTNKPVQNVASAKRPSQTGRKKTVRLTPSQVAIAKRLGVPLEEYAKHLTTKEV